MKKFYAILLSIALVLGFAAAASASTLTASGTVEFYGEYVSGSGWDYYGLDTADLKLKLANEWGPASADFTTKFEWGWGFIDSANFNYKFSDSLTAGVLYKDGGYKLYSANVFPDWKAVDDLAKVAFTFDGGSVTLFSDIQPDPIYFYGAGSYSFDPVTVSGWFAYEGDFFAIAEAKYAVTDEFSVTGGIAGGEFYDTLVGAKAVYATDGFSVEGKVNYNVDAEDLYYNLYADYGVTDNITVYGEYDEVAGFAFGASYEFGADTSLSADYGVDAETLGVTLSLAF